MRNIRKMVKEVETDGNEGDTKPSVRQTQTTPRRGAVKAKVEYDLTADGDEDDVKPSVCQPPTTPRRRATNVNVEYDLTTPPPLTPDSDPSSKSKCSATTDKTPHTPTPKRQFVYPATPVSNGKVGAGVMGGRVAKPIPVKRSLRARKTMDYGALFIDVDDDDDDDDDDESGPVKVRDTSKHARVESEDSADSDANYESDGVEIMDVA